MVSKLSPILEDGHVERQFKPGPIPVGLVVSIASGIFVRGDVLTDVPAADITVTDDDITYIYLNTNTLLVVGSITFPVEDFMIIVEVTAVSGVVTSMVDWRSRSSGLLDVT